MTRLAGQTPLGERPNRGEPLALASGPGWFGPVSLPGRSLEVTGNRHPRKMVAHDRTRLIDPLRPFTSLPHRSPTSTARFETRSQTSGMSLGHRPRATSVAIGLDRPSLAGSPAVGHLSSVMSLRLARERVRTRGVPWVSGPAFARRSRADKPRRALRSARGTSAPASTPGHRP